MKATLKPWAGGPMADEPYEIEPCPDCGKPARMHYVGPTKVWRHYTHTGNICSCKAAPDG